MTTPAGAKVAVLGQVLVRALAQAKALPLALCSEDLDPLDERALEGFLKRENPD